MLNFKRNIEKYLLLLTTALAHPHIDGLSHIDLILLKPNTTAITQPMDQGVSKMLKGSLSEIFGKAHASFFGCHSIITESDVTSSRPLA